MNEKVGLMTDVGIKFRRNGRRIILYFGTYNQCRGLHRRR